MTLAELSKTSSSSGRKARRSWAAVGLTAAALVSSGCGGASTPATTTVTQVTTVETTVTQSATEPAPPSPSSSDASTAKTPNSSPTTTKLEKTTTVTVPDGVGKDYQSAQDVWRGTGLVVGVAKDATGANRLALLDSNWLVVSQDLAAGTKVPVDTIITATIKKFTDE